MTTKPGSAAELGKAADATLNPPANEAAEVLPILPDLEVDDLTTTVKDDVAGDAGDADADAVLDGAATEGQAADGGQQDTEIPPADGVAADAAADTTAAAAVIETPAVVDPAAAEAQKAAAAAQKAAAEAERQYADRVNKHNGEWAALKQKIAGGTFDPLDEDDAKLQARLTMERTELLEERLAIVTRRDQQTAQQQQIADDWARWGKENPGVSIADGQRLLQEEFARLQKKFPGSDISAAAIDAFDNRIAQLKGGAAKPAVPSKPVVTGKPAAAKTPAGGPPKTPVTQGGGTVTPKPVVHRPPEPKLLSTDEKLEKGKYGNLANIV